MARTFKRQWVLVCASLVTAACLVISPLDGVNQEGASTGGGGSDGSTGGQSGTAGVGAECTTHIECSEADEPARCVESKCVQLRTADCPCIPNVPGDAWKDDDSILIGAFAPLNTSGTSEQRCDEPGSWNYRIALEDINAVNIGGLPGPGTKARKIAVLICDNQSVWLSNNKKTPQAAKAAVRAATQHLTEAVKVPAVLAYLDPGDMVEVFGEFGSPNGVMFLTPNGPTEAFANFEDPNKLAWHMLGIPADVAPTYAAVFELVRPFALELPHVDPDAGLVGDASVGPDGSVDALRVALLHTADAFSADLTPAVKTLLEQEQGVNWSDPNTAREYQVTGAESFEKAVYELGGWKPHIIISTGYGASFILEKAQASGWYPYLILSPFDLADLSHTVIWVEAAQKSSVLTAKDLHRRFIYVNAAGSEDLQLLSDYKKRLGTHAGPDEISSENLYDSAYFLAYAMYAGSETASPTGLLTGGVGMPKLLQSGPNFNVGPDDINKVFQAVEGVTGQVRLNGTMGPPVFDPRGIRKNTGQLDCLFQYPNFKLELREHVGHFDTDSAPATLRAAKQYINDAGTVEGLPCLEWLGLPPS